MYKYLFFLNRNFRNFLVFSAVTIGSQGGVGELQSKQQIIIKKIVNNCYYFKTFRKGSQVGKVKCRTNRILMLIAHLRGNGFLVLYGYEQYVQNFDLKVTLGEHY